MHDIDVATVARLLGDPSRATMLTALLDGRALTAGELARIAGIKSPAASAHLARLLDGGVVAMAAQGRHRYYRLAGPDVASVLESLAVVAERKPVRTLRASAAARALRPARMCYDHIAGVLGVRLHDHLVGSGAVQPSTDGLMLTPLGVGWFHRCGIDAAAVRTRRPLLRDCLDWTERRYHLAGALPAQLAARFVECGWVQRRAPGERGLTVTAMGSVAIAELLETPDLDLTA